MHLAVTGSSGLVGARLVSLLSSAGHRVTRLVRRTPRTGEAAWDPQSGEIDVRPLEGIDAAVHLAGENIAARRWTASFKQRVRDSRVRGTESLARALAGMSRPPRVLVSASAVGFYGDRGAERLDESSPPGAGFLAETCRQWEAATEAASRQGMRVVLPRFGMILSRDGGALAKMIPPFRLGLGGRVGDGRQMWSWIGLTDAVRAISRCVDDASLAGPVNVVSPQPVTNAQFTHALAEVVRRPAWLPAPAMAVRLALGEMADELLLASAAVLPRKLLESGFEFEEPTLELALRNALK